MINLRKFLVLTIPIVTLVLFVLVMFSGDFLKYPLGQDDNIPEAIATVMQDVNNENWDRARQSTDHLEKAWDKVVKRIQFSLERDEINAFSTSLARLQGALQAQDKSAMLIELNEAYEHWRDLGN